MRTTFIGVGEAFDDNQLNTSLLIETAESSLLLDCGFTAPMGFWKAAAHPLDLQAIYISHFHGDHFFGLPALLMRMKQEGRTAPLTILGQPGVEAVVRQTIELAYPGSLAKASFDLSFMECSAGQNIVLGHMCLGFALSDHPRPCLAIRVDCGDRALFYSGDGGATADTAALAAGADLIIHESFTMDADTPGHGTVDASIDFARRAGARQLALVHIERDVRKYQNDQLQQRISLSQEPHVIVPESGDSITITSREGDNFTSQV
ncbi:Beta-lactamase domain-containing protein [Pseudodesulfovibrio profundus]|uniref:Beta-lactamase domain-containing protein n=1 Tax=Pseudodesulfovibrio profundus TaxID=57320 RepID=A0A2C8F7F3_9BACT|nr:MBL fold metallo-hydrolase [Pseudodesulfovibrio profundus]SOB58448.1 Beta-lactamase domain-containing protein [Pseudodesulfovibrio profundus]